MNVTFYHARDISLYQILRYNLSTYARSGAMKRARRARLEKSQQLINQMEMMKLEDESLAFSTHAKPNDKKLPGIAS